MRSPVAALTIALAVLCGPAAAQTPERPAGIRTVTLSSLTAQGFEVKAITAREALIVQKDKDVYWCTLRLAQTAPLSYQSECYSIR